MKSASTIALIAFAFCIAGCNDQASGPADFSGTTMGTQYSIKVASIPATTGRDGLQKQIDSVLNRINSHMSTHIAESDLSRFKSHAANDWFTASVETIRVIAEAEGISEKTGGAFDVTVAPLVNLWNFGPEKKADDAALPTDETIEAARSVVGYQKLKWRFDGGELGIMKEIEGLMVDLSAIAKGHAVDEVARALEHEGVTAYLIEIGGEIRTKGTKADGKAWSVGIEAPSETKRTIQKSLPLTDQSLATSGDYRNFYEKDGKRYSHTIDPRTGKPVEHNLASVSVIDERCLIADAMATALMVMGPDDGYDFAAENNIAAYFVVRGDDGFAEKATPAFEAIAGKTDK